MKDKEMKDQENKEALKKKSSCSHGPKGRCTNCLPDPKTENKDEK